jgi:endo-1,4-beta-xylanase
LDGSPELPLLTIQDVPEINLLSNSCSFFDTTQASIEYSPAGAGDSDRVISSIDANSSLRFHFKIQSNTNSWKHFAIQGSPFGESDPWWKGLRRMDVFIDEGHYSISLFDGNSSDYAVTIPVKISSDQAITIQFLDVLGTSFDILDENNQVTDHVDLAQEPKLQFADGLFPNGVAYISFNVGYPGTMKIKDLSVTSQPSGKWKTDAFSLPGLRMFSEKAGITTSSTFISSQTLNPKVCAIWQNDFDVAVITGFSSPDIWVGPGEYNFSQLDTEVDLAILRGHKVLASHLVFGEPESLPNWLKKGNYSKDEYSQLLKDYIDAVVSHYKGRVSEWSIANEASSRDFYPGLDFWYDKIGPEYIENSFRWAHEADPNGVLIFNDVNNDNLNDSRKIKIINSMYKTVQSLKAKGVQIDVVGMQMHLLEPWDVRPNPSKEDVIATMQEFAKLGVSIYITEMDVSLQKQTGTAEEKLNFQADVYGDMLNACLESGVCKRFTVWGISDGTNYTEYKNAAPVIFDANYQPKPAYFRVQKILENQ